MARIGYLGLFLPILGVIYQWRLKELLFVTFGLGRTVNPIENFPYKCRRLEHKQLEACGDLWLDDKHRILYAACSGATGRESWNPTLSKFNYTGRRPSGSQLMALYIDTPRKDGLFKIHPIQPTNYGSAPGDNKLDLSGFDVETFEDGKIHRFWLINQRPSYDINGRLLDASTHGTNTTVDVYEHRTGASKMTFIAKGWSPTLHSATRIAVTGANNFVVSNERAAPRGLKRKLDAVLGGASLVNHDDWFDTYRVTDVKVRRPTAVVRGRDDRIYVASGVDGRIRVFEPQPWGALAQVHAFDVGMSVAGLTGDGDGDFWAVARSRFDATGLESTNAVFRIKRVGDEWVRFVTEEILEDGEARFLKGASVVRHDVKTKRLFFGGSNMPFMSVCEPV